MSERYQIELDGILDGAWADWLGELTLRQTTGGSTILTGTLADQAALHGLLARIRDLGLPIRLVARLDENHPDLSKGVSDEEPKQTA
ncbi:MAG: hypothetical protein KDE34_11095 [Anaerolineales bacterium]|nr:hypothetical protein [Anaerolineales bacterium]